MNDLTHVVVECSKCGKLFEDSIQQCVVKEAHPELHSAIVDDEFFYKKCPHCGHMQSVDLPVVYYDMENKAVFVYVKGDMEFAHAHNFVEEQIADFGIEREQCTIRMVSMQNELREKVILVDNGLDDRVVEVMKLYGLDRMREDGHNQKFEEVRCSVLENGKLGIDFVGPEPMHQVLDRSIYNRLADIVLPIAEQMPTPLEVSTEWAIQFDVANRI